VERLPALFYELPSGRSPVREWIRSLDVADRKIIEATLRLLSTEGYDRTSIESVAAEAQAKSGHDILALSTWLPSRYADQLVSMDDVMAELIKSDLEAVGFTVTLDAQDAGSYWGKVNGGQSQLNMNQRSLWVPDPDNKVTLLESHNASAHGDNEHVPGWSRDTARTVTASNEKPTESNSTPTPRRFTSSRHRA